MDFTWVAIAHSHTFLIAAVFVLGLLAKQIGLPPLVGFLLAGFLMKALGTSVPDGLHTLADLGITLLLFTIGLKLNLRSLIQPVIWGVTSVHVVLVVLLFGGLFKLISYIGLPLFLGLDFKTAALLAFALSFSSTVFAVKLLEEKGELKAAHGRIAIGVLIMQDVIAVIYLTATSGELPSPWALLVLAGLIAARPLLLRLIKRADHGELLVIAGFILAMGGASLFELVHMKADLGALVIGMILARTERASEMASALLAFKDLFLVGFFLSIGLNASITPQVIWVALLVLLLMPLKTMAFFWLFNLFKLRSRTSFLTSLTLANYSEFGLIVCAIGFGNGWLSSEWLGVMALAMSFTFIIASPFNVASHRLYARIDKFMSRLQRAERLQGEQIIDTGDAEILVFGMGRIGTAAYDTLHQTYGNRVLGIDNDAIILEKHKQQGRHVIQGDATDVEFWEKLRTDKVRVILLDMPKAHENLFAFQLLQASGFKGKVAATAKYDDQVDMLKNAGLDAAYSIYGEAGAGFATHVCEELCSDIRLSRS